MAVELRKALRGQEFWFRGLNRGGRKPRAERSGDEPRPPAHWLLYLGEKPCAIFEVIFSPHL